ncbi:hypothetical protein DFQ28_006650 [Apophysomyces sp. BC1034]|nr:hypothetical protein DFQ30_004681 [Apophysomyces sp. BC1015]KAG0182547.1 hypothetical protein DFQ29_003549 [Apophysomyces sp. BC1021]KAG0193056.1 hypothetical protein DFQ28_006650 [Apophysomyces sp. BC1034]
MVNSIRKTNDLKIDLVSDEIVLLGHAEESAGKMLQGSLMLNLAEPMKVKSIVLRFTGKMKVSWSEGIGHHQHYHKQERTIVDHKWQFVPAIGVVQKKTQLLPAGQHKWNFEFLLPGDLPQSLEAEGGRVTYRLKAIVERPAFIHNMIKKRPVRLVRCMLPSEFELSQTLEIHNTWADKMVYDIVLPSKVYAYGENIPMTFNILPIASQLRVRSIMGTLKEYCTYTANEYSKTDTRIVKVQRQDDPFSADYSAHWTRVVNLPVPEHSPLVFCDADNEMIRIRHKLKFIISLINADGHLSELRCSVPVIIVDSFAQQTELNMLPAYDQTWRSVPYDPSVVAALRTANAVLPPAPQHSREPVTISGHTRSLSIASNNIKNDQQPAPVEPNDNNDDEDSLWWQGMDLSRVPSYRTALQNEPVALSSSLPTYDSLAMTPRVTL